MSRRTLVAELGSLQRFKERRTSRWARWPVRHAVVKFALVRARLTGETTPVQAATFWEDSMSVELPEPLSADVYRYGCYESGLTRALVELLDPGDVFIDIGAHFGYFSLLASRLIGDEGQVHAFEPVPDTARRLEQNLDDASNTSVHQAAVWSRSGVVEMQSFDVQRSMYASVFSPRMPDSERGEQVEARNVKAPSVALDDLVPDELPPPTFVKIDAESAEKQVLIGMRGVLERIRPVVSVEVGDVGVDEAPASREVLEFVRSRGYRLFECDTEGLRPHRIKREYDYANILLLAEEQMDRLDRIRTRDRGTARE